MKHYLVQFMYKTDLRYEVEVWAQSESIALLISYHNEFVRENHMENWTSNGEDFYLIIRRD